MTEQLQKFVFEEGYIVCAANHELVLAAQDTDSSTNVTLAKRRPDDIYQRWLLQENG